jgi:hypothetical protein
MSLFVLLGIYYYVDKIKENEMCDACSTPRKDDKYTEEFLWET